MKAPVFIGGRNVTLTEVTVSHNDAPGQLGTLCQVYIDPDDGKCLLQIRTDCDHQDGIAEFGNTKKIADYLQKFYGDDEFLPDDTKAFIQKLRSM